VFLWCRVLLSATWGNRKASSCVRFTLHTLQICTEHGTCICTRGIKVTFPTRIEDHFSEASDPQTRFRFRFRPPLVLQGAAHPHYHTACWQAQAQAHDKPALVCVGKHRRTTSLLLFACRLCFHAVMTSRQRGLRRCSGDATRVAAQHRSVPIGIGTYGCALLRNNRPVQNLRFPAAGATTPFRLFKN
jgi:hypothetical protein